MKQENDFRRNDRPRMSPHLSEVSSRLSPGAPWVMSYGPGIFGCSGDLICALRGDLTVRDTT